MKIVYKYSRVGPFFLLDGYQVLAPKATEGGRHRSCIYPLESRVGQNLCEPILASVSCVSLGALIFCQLSPCVNILHTAWLLPICAMSNYHCILTEGAFRADIMQIGREISLSYVLLLSIHYWMMMRDLLMPHVSHTVWPKQYFISLSSLICLMW